MRFIPGVFKRFDLVFLIKKDDILKNESTS